MFFSEAFQRLANGVYKLIGNLVIDDTLTITDGTDSHIIKAVQETGLGGRLTIGLDETARTLVICDAGDVDTDLGLSAQGHPAITIMRADGLAQTVYRYDNITAQNNYDFAIQTGNPFAIRLFGQNLASGNMLVVDSLSTRSLTDADGEQSWLYVEPKINQSGTAAYNALKIAVTETAAGDGSAGQGKNLIWAGVGGTRMFEVDNGGIGYFAGVLTAASYTDNTPGFEGDALAELAGVKTKGGEIDHATLPVFARKAIVQKRTTYGPKTEYTAAEALEEYDAEVPDYDLVEVVDQKTKAVKTAKRLKVLSYKTKAHKLQEDGSVFEEKEPVYQTKTAKKKRLRKGFEFDEATGKFFRKGEATHETTEKPGRDISAMVSMLTVAVQQLTAEIDKLKEV